MYFAIYQAIVKIILTFTSKFADSKKLYLLKCVDTDTAEEGA